jgi:hypothetical protein
MMKYRGHIKNGVVVLDDGATLPDGTEVLVRLVAHEPADAKPADDKTVGQRLMKFAGKAKGLAPDASHNHDHYLYGTPKR